MTILYGSSGHGKRPGQGGNRKPGSGDTRRQKHKLERAPFVIDPKIAALLLVVVPTAIFLVLWYVLVENQSAQAHGPRP